MIIPMTKYSFVLLSEQAGDFLQKVSELGVVDITRSSKPADEESLGILDSIRETKHKIESIEKCEDENTKILSSHIADLEKKAQQIEVWGEFDNSKLMRLAANGVHMHFYAIASKKFQQEWTEQYPVFVINELKGKTYFVLAGPKIVNDFPVPELEIPHESAGLIRKQIEKFQSDLAEHKAKLEAKKNEIPALQQSIEEKSAELERHLAGLSSSRAAEGMLTTMVGFAPSENDATLQAELDKLDVYYISENAIEEDNPPIKLKNNKFSSMFEVLTNMYGMPVYGEFDPTVFLSIFFLLFFAMCMGDAGYGLLLIAIGFFLKGKEGGLAKLYKLIITLGIGTTVIGFFLGTAFGVDLSQQSWIPQGLRSCMVTGEIAGYSAQMILALGVGVLHLCLALIMKAIWSIRRSGVKDSLSAMGWATLIVGTVVVLAFAIVGLLSESAAKWLIIGIAAVSALGIYVFNKVGRNPLMNIGAGLWDTYNMASGLMGDVLSYIRLYALGLSGGMLGSTFNLIAQMVKGDDPTWQWIPFVLVLLVGHVLNLAMSVLGAFVHPLRLNFVEFFKNSGYEGRGAEYRPLTSNKSK